MELARLYRDHITTLAGLAEGALERSHAAGRGFDGIVFHAGAIHSYHADDLSVPFRSTPHFVRFAPVPGPDHLLLFRPGESVRLVRVVPEGYWEEPPETPVHPFAEVLVVEEVPNRLAAARRLGGVSSCAYVGDDPDLAAALGIEPDGVEPPALLSALDWDRAYKTPYEVACIREANRIAARGHRAARRGFGQCLSERAIHADYLAATGLLEAETPYPNIIAWDDRAAVLHYQRKRAPDPRILREVDAE